MKKILFGLIASLLALLVGVASFAGFPPSYLMAAPGVATGIGSKLLCSARYVSGFSQQQSFDDLVQYSGILQGLTVEYDEAQKSRNDFFIRLEQEDGELYTEHRLCDRLRRF